MKARRVLWLSIAAGGLALAFASPVSAQQSGRHRLSEYTLTAGSIPTAGTTPESTRHRITLGTLGGGFSGVSASSASHILDVGFTPAYRPPAEIQDLVFVNQSHLEWRADPSVGSYNLYSGDIAGLSGDKYGECAMSGLLAAKTEDESLPDSGSGIFYLATAVNRILEEGSLGQRSDGALRENTTPCP